MQDAEVIKFSQIDGNISLVLRSAKDCTVDARRRPDRTARSSSTTGITLRRLVDDFGVLPPQVVQVLEPTPYPQSGRAHPVAVTLGVPLGAPSVGPSPSP